MANSYLASTDRQIQSERAVSTGLGGLILAGTICVVVGLTSYVELLNVLFPILCVGVGGWFLAFVPQYYVSFSIWLWFVTPFIRRFVDYQMGQFSEDSVIMIAPYIVSGLGILSILRHWRSLKHSSFMPLIVGLVATTYGLLITFGLGSPVQAVTAYLGWSGPIILAMIVMIHWEEYEKFRSAIIATFMWAMLILGSYSLIQYFVFPPWDEMWMVGAEMSSIGLPERLKVRVWSMLNSPGPFATVVMAALVLQFIEKGVLSKLASFVGVIGLVLSNVRSAWVGFIFALLVAFVFSDGKLKQRLLVIILFAVFVGVPLFLKSPLSAPISERFSDRMESMENIEDDGSLKARLRLYTDAPALILSSPLGRGYASTAYDSGWVAILSHLGWFGGLAYLYGLLGTAWLTYRAKPAPQDRFAVLSMAVALSFLFLMVSGSQNYGVLGFVMWTMFAITQAAGFTAAGSSGTQ